MAKEVFFLFHSVVKIFLNKFYYCASGGCEKELEQEEFLEKLVAVTMRWPW